MTIQDYKRYIQNQYEAETKGRQLKVKLAESRLGRDLQARERAQLFAPITEVLQDALLTLILMIPEKENVHHY